jgi:hypothetical protein
MTTALERPQKSKSAQIRDQLGYSVIDTDVHTQEFPPAFLDYLESVGGTEIVDRFQEQLPGASRSKWFHQTEEERRAYRTARPPFWTRPTKDTYSLATVSLPKLLHERLQEAGTDFAVQVWVGQRAVQFPTINITILDTLPLPVKRCVNPSSLVE